MEGDRQMMIVQEDGIFLSQRKHPKMALIQPEVISSTELKLTAPNMPEVMVEHTRGKGVQQVTVWKDTFKAVTLNPVINTWLSEYLGIKVNLVKYEAISKRLIDTNFAKNEEQVAFADGYPILVTHQSTFDQINQALTDPVKMSRFRPNIVLESNQEAWQELNWNELTHNGLVIDLVKPCARCIMTGINQQTGIQTGTEVFKTLQTKFPHNNKAVFGVNAIPHIRETKDTILSVGLELEVT